jgi:hypothetical protein
MKNMLPTRTMLHLGALAMIVCLGCWEKATFLECYDILMFIEGLFCSPLTPEQLYVGIVGTLTSSHRQFALRSHSLAMAGL